MPAKARVIAVSEDLRTRARLVHDRLCAAYGCPIPYFHDLDPLSEMVSSLLSHRTRNAESGKAFKQLRARFGTWEEVRDAPTAEVEACVAPCTWPEQKAPRVQQALRAITERRGGELSLDFLADWPVVEAREWLEEIPGVGPKTSAATLLFSRLRMPALPVDSHHHRVAIRLGLIPANVRQRPLMSGFIQLEHGDRIGWGPPTVPIILHAGGRPPLCMTARCDRRFF